MLREKLFNRRYRVLKTLGAGAQGEVMLATDTVSERQVALKVLHVGQEAGWQELFKHEFEILADLAHPHLATVYDFGATADNTVYFTRDFIEGKELMRATEDCSVIQFLAICVQLCRALRPLHRSGLIHGDIKPGNLVLGPLQPAGEETWRCEAHPIDFSFVRVAHGQSPPRGTLQYMAPEILSSEPIDVRADLYALGVSLFQAMTGVCPFEPDASAILHAHRNAIAPKFSSVRIRVENNRQDSMLDALKPIVLRLLAANPEDRYPDLDELEAALTSVCPTATVSDNVSAIPSRNVLATRTGFSGAILENVQKRLTHQAAVTLNVIEGEVGSGRGAVRRAVKWQAQLTGTNVAEISLSGRGDYLNAMSGLLRQFSMLLGDTEEGKESEELASLLKHADYSSVETRQISLKVAALAGRLAGQKPLLITVENVDRADPENLTLLRAIIAESSESSPLAVLVTTVMDHAWQDSLGPGAAFQISALDENEVAELIRRYLGIDGKPLAARIVTHTGGNPLFVTQLLRDCITTSKSPESLLEQTVVSDVSSYWQLKLTQLTSDDLRVLKACALLNRPCDKQRIAMVAQLKTENLERLNALCDTRWLTRAGDEYMIRSTAMAAEVLSTVTDFEKRDLASRAFESETIDTHKIMHAATCGKIDFVNEHAVTIVTNLERSGALSMAKEIADTVLRCPIDESCDRELSLILGRLLIALGELESAKTRLQKITQTPASSTQQSAYMYLGRIFALQSAVDEAATLLHRALSINETGDIAPSIYYELCEIDFRRGHYLDAIELANRGLELSTCDEKTACSLLCSKAKANAALGKHDVAIALADDAVIRATQCNEKQRLAFARDVRAWVLSLTGKMKAATEELEKCVVLYREVGDVARLTRSLQVVGNNYWWLERWDLMLKKHDEAMRVAASLDNPAGRNEQLISYGFALNCIGRFEKSALILSQAKSEAQRLDDAFQQARVSVYEGDLNAWQGRYDNALENWKQGYKRFEQLSNFGLLAELCLEIAGVLISKDGPTHIADAEGWIRRAKSYRRENLGRHFDELLLLTEGQLLLAQNEYQQGFSKLCELIEKSTDTPNRQLKWQAHLFIAEAQIKKNMSVLARKQLREAEKLLSQLSSRFSIADQKSFWQDVRRARLRQLLTQTEGEDFHDSEQLLLQPSGNTDVEAAKLYRVLDFNKRISKENDLQQLTIEILDVAIELTGAERGFFLVKEAQGLVIRAEKDLSSSGSQSPEVQFSSSIAESVYLDNEPVLTIDAARDPRFNEFLSIHHLQIKSVACLPVAYRNQVLGVLYLENRLARGKFDYSDMRVLSAFSDQMAIALAHAKAIDEINHIRHNLEETTCRLQELVNQQTEDLRSKDASLELAQEQLARLKSRVAGTGAYHGLIGSGAQMQQVFAVIERVKNNDIPVVVVGESGTGKDAVARVIHEVSPRQQGPFVTLPCGAIPENLVESTLFGHKQGAFSGAQSDTPGLFESAIGGTLYLDDLAEMPKRMQVDLLRVLQEGAFSPLGDHRKIRADFRLLCSSRIPLSELVDQGRLRADLFYRLQVISIQLPPLRERTEDIPLLAGAIIKREAVKLDLPDTPLSAATLNEFMHAQWPGNIRELEQSIRRTLIIGDELLAIHTQTQPTFAADSAPFSAAHRRNSDQEKKEILDALERNQWNKSKTAKALGMPRRTFYRRLKQFDIV